MAKSTFTRWIVWFRDEQWAFGHFLIDTIDFDQIYSKHV